MATSRYPFQPAALSFALAICCVAVACATQLAPSSNGPPPMNALSDRSSRCATSGATCLSRDYIARRAAWRLSDILVSAGAVTRRCHRTDFRLADACAVYMTSTAGPGTCVPAIFVDGARFRGEPEALLTDLDQHISATTTTSIEIYRSARQPAGFADITGGCGSIVIWTDR